MATMKEKLKKSTVQYHKHGVAAIHFSDLTCKRHVISLDNFVYTGTAIDIESKNYPEVPSYAYIGTNPARIVFTGNRPDEIYDQIKKKERHPDLLQYIGGASELILTPTTKKESHGRGFPYQGSYKMKVKE